MFHDLFLIFKVSLGMVFNRTQIKLCELFFPGFMCEYIGNYKRKINAYKNEKSVYVRNYNCYILKVKNNVK